jgi:hypothetical protein
MVDIVDFEIVGPYTLRIQFNDSAERIINCEPVLYGYYYARLRDIEFFNQVRVDPEVHILVWPNGADVDPATLYNWLEGDGAELAQRAPRWQKAEAGRVQDRDPGKHSG